MGETERNGGGFLIITAAVVLLFFGEALAKSRVPLSEAEIRQRKYDCTADIESGLWGKECKSSAIAKENCVLRCLSPLCYELIYETDPLEEGEKDITRGSEFRYCMQRASLGESLEGIGERSFNG